MPNTTGSVATAEGSYPGGITCIYYTVLNVTSPFRVKQHQQLTWRHKRMGRASKNRRRPPLRWRRGLLFSGILNSSFLLLDQEVVHVVLDDDDDDDDDDVQGQQTKVAITNLPIDLTAEQVSWGFTKSLSCIGLCHIQCYFRAPRSLRRRTRFGETSCLHRSFGR